MANPRSLLQVGTRILQTNFVRKSSNDINALKETTTLRMRHGEKWPGIFTETELECRLSKLRKYMEDSGLAACLFTSLHNVNYYTGGYLYYTFGRSYGVLVTPEKHVTITPLVDASFPWRRSPHDNIIYTDWKRDNYYKAILKELGDTRGAVGIEYDHVNLEVFKRLKDHLPNDLRDVSAPTMKIRMVKSKEEIAMIKKSAAIADIGGWAAVEALAENVPEYEVALAATRAMVRSIAKEFPDTDLMDTWAWCQSGDINTGGAHNPVTTRRIQKGDIININCFPMPQGYYSALERNLFLDHCDDASLKYWEANLAVHKRGLELVKPGARCCDIANELNEMVAQSGLLKYRTFGYGHSFGVMCHYYGREAGLELREDIETVLEPGMVLSMEPMILIPPGQPGSGGYREHDLLVVSEDGGAENLTRFPVGPEFNIIKT